MKLSTSTHHRLLKIHDNSLFALFCFVMLMSATISLGNPSSDIISLLVFSSFLFFLIPFVISVVLMFDKSGLSDTSIGDEF